MVNNCEVAQKANNCEVAQKAEASLQAAGTIGCLDLNYCHWQQLHRPFSYRIFATLQLSFRTMIFGTSSMMVSMGTAKLMPLLRPVPLLVKVAVFIPTIRPKESNSGPPELPELMEASVWTAPKIRSPEAEGMVLLSPLTEPTVRV